MIRASATASTGGESSTTRSYVGQQFQRFAELAAVEDLRRIWPASAAGKNVQVRDVRTLHRRFRRDPTGEQRRQPGVVLHAEDIVLRGISQVGIDDQDLGRPGPSRWPDC